MKQLTLAAVGFERYAKTTRRAAFLRLPRRTSGRAPSETDCRDRPFPIELFPVNKAERRVLER